MADGATPRPSTAISARSCRPSIAGPTTTACRALQDRLHPAERAACRGSGRGLGPGRRGRQEGSAMTIGLVFLTLLMAVIVWWLFRQTINVQPWQAQGAGADAPAVAVRPPVKTALWVFLAVATSLFVLFVSAYAMRLSLRGLDPAAPAPAADAEHRGAGRRQPGHGVDGACRPPRRQRQRAARPVGQRPADASASSPGSCIVWKHCTTPASSSRPAPPPPFSICSPRCTACTCSAAWWHGPAHRCRAWRGRRPGQDPAGRRAVRDLLAFPARRLGGAVCAARVGRLGLAICTSAPL